MCGSPHYPGSWPHRAPYPERGCAVVPAWLNTPRTSRHVFEPPGRQAPESWLFFASWRLRVRLFPGPSGKPANPRPTTHVPFPTSTRLCHKARGCAGRRTTPGPVHITFPTPKGVVPSFRLGTTPHERHGTYLSPRDAKHPNPISSPRLRVSARDFFRVPRKGMRLPRIDGQ